MSSSASSHAGRVPHRRGLLGFTMIELMIVVVVIGIIAAVGIPQYSKYRHNAKVGQTAAEYRNIAQGFYAYFTVHGTWPPDSHMTLPAGMDRFLDPSIWSDGTPLGGTYNWEGPNNYPYAGISVYPPGVISNEDLTTIDNLIDNGDLNTGKFRIGTNGRGTWILDE